MMQAPPIPASRGGPLPLLSTNQLTPSLVTPTMQDPLTLASTRGLLPLSSPTQPTLSSSTQSVPDIGPSVWRPLPEDYQELLYLHRFNGPYQTWSEIPQPESDSRTGVRKHTGGSISFTEMIMKWQKDLIERFSRNKYLEELHKHQKKGEKKGKSIKRPRKMLKCQILLCPIISI
ncbi:hypothetical protein M9H77_26532 [Catharanthus roseus]|uniref:Uncharacterized protein n=1 Tax=Catharanthus roseus TaxID=4058 RepID=A0ACC0AAV3_CATRO|nr:hypothetical protein M9H77_26532 [Catharanthus roseus]